MKGYSIHIGVNQPDYGTSLELTAAEKDAVLMEKLAKSKGFIVTGILLDSNAKISIFDDLVKSTQSKMTPNDTLLITFSGHGAYTLRGGGLEAMCFFDKMLFEKKLLKLLSRNLGMDNKIILVSDSCYAGGLITQENSILNSNEFTLKELNQEDVEHHIENEIEYYTKELNELSYFRRESYNIPTKLLAAANENQRAWERPEKNGLFTESLINTINLNIPSYELFINRIRQDVERIPTREIQSPEIRQKGIRLPSFDNSQPFTIT